ncbi:winged helix-turn-helix transcriptional regulator [Treponema sp.]|uniref:winged helix-turn-helix transcriptional regulator n=1 Tax=Treponema sp. TaxID=166 RepID=UPI003EFC1618
MNTDVATLQNISDTLKEEPLASQRVLAENAGMSIGLMNAVIKRFVERGWIMLTNVNLRKFSYAITPAGIAELTARSQTFAKRTFAIANKYNDTLCNAVAQAKKDGKTKLVLYGKSYIKFLLVYACQTLNVTFLEKDTADPIESDAFCVVGEQCAEDDIEWLTENGCVNLLDLIEE